MYRIFVDGSPLPIQPASRPSSSGGWQPQDLIAAQMENAKLRELVSSKRLLCVLAEERTTLREVLVAFELPASFRPLFNMERLPTSRKELELEPGA